MQYEYVLKRNPPKVRSDEKSIRAYFRTHLESASEVIGYTLRSVFRTAARSPIAANAHIESGRNDGVRFSVVTGKDTGNFGNLDLRPRLKFNIQIGAGPPL